jgi:alpha-tubulin suppressor-like RCC1 family protein
VYVFVFSKKTYQNVGERIVVVAAGYSHSAAVTIDGNVYIWG